MTARGGFVLLYSLLLVLTGATITAGMLALATREAAIARRYLDLGRARSAAEAEARGAFQSWSTVANRDLAPGNQRTTAGRKPDTRVTIARLDATLFMVSAAARISAGAGPPVVSRAGMLVRTLDHGAIEAAFPGALAATASAVLRGGRASGRDACRADPDQRPGVTAPAVTVQGSLLEGDPPLQLDAPAPAPPGWPLDSANAAFLADIRMERAEVAPRPHAVNDSCALGPTNWGALSPLHPCGDLQQIIHSTGDLTIRGGEGRGILISDGSLILGEGFEFHGLVLARDRVSLLPGVRVRGAIRARSVDLEDAEVLLDRCALRAAIGTPALDRAYRPGARWWIPVF